MQKKFYIENRNVLIFQTVIIQLKNPNHSAFPQMKFHHSFH
ncbi:hypothetical protein LEP1GSC125_3662 [Leptospira mayottensis 200901122]|uniref:Uncharacterized protein n=1 Tax=Leptospira mayottensis 200901122 TaxID=1193010 RepID=A0AA87MP17_9LEPT|nr:hypothetical protein LEP1GSC125_3662 [Leptospira mayottensis 200901122]